MAGDPFFNDVALLIGFEDKNDGDTSATDESPVARSLSFVGAGVEVDDAFAAFGTKSVVITANSSIRATKTSDLSVANTNDKTYEAWIRPNTLGVISTIMNGRDGSGGEEFSFFIDSDNTLGFNAFVPGDTTVVVSTATISANVQTHVAATREDVAGTRTWRLFIGGNLEDSGTESGTPGSNSSPFFIGQSGFSSARWFRGNIDEIRVTDGIARYTANFTPPTAQFPRGPIITRAYYDRLLAGAA